LGIQKQGEIIAGLKRKCDLSGEMGIIGGASGSASSWQVMLILRIDRREMRRLFSAVFFTVFLPR